jgi:hypothetical protein
MTRAPLVDWSLLVLLLRRRAGLTYSAIGRRSTSDERHIGRLARGDVKEPRFGTGVLLLDLAADHLSESDWRQVRLRSPLARERSERNERQA